MRTKIKYPVQTCRPRELLPSVLMEEADRKTGVKLHADTDFHNKKDDEAYLVFFRKILAKKILRTQRAEIMVRVFENLRASFFSFWFEKLFFPEPKAKNCRTTFFGPTNDNFLVRSGLPQLSA